MNESKKIMITGGHASPAIAVIDRLEALYPQHSIVFVGRKFNNGQESSESFEYQEIQKRKITFINLKAEELPDYYHCVHMYIFCLFHWDFSKQYEFCCMSNLILF
ncbi:MAG TPA: hypothetical protein VJB65_00700 [Patescibacteria group bacterium]|nr:hypothetical protein [Patescibacteria group bacterium]